jgi:hypothetical protein
MSTSRRQFLLSTAGAAVGAILPSFYFRALEHFEQFGESLLLVPAHATQDLCVLDNDGELELFLGDPFEEPPDMTYREYFARFEPESLESVAADWGIGPEDLDTLIHYEYLLDDWFMHGGPAAQAHAYLQTLDLGKSLAGPDAVGRLDFFEDSNMTSMWRGVRVDDEVTVSLLQQRLNDLDTGVVVRFVDPG